MDLLEVKHVTKRYTNHTALDDVSLTIPKGSIYGLLGPNGAGKTTLIRIITRITAPDSGEVLFNGRPLSPSDIYRIGYLPEERGLYKKMKVGEQALYFAQLKGMSKREATEKLKTWFIKFGIQDWWNKKVEELSKGMAQKVQFIVTILHEPELLILDEPFSGFDPINANLLKEEILDLKKKGSTIIFSTHNMSSVEEMCDYITLINKSHNILSGSVDDIRHQYGSNVYDVDFIGDKNALIQTLEPLCTIVPTGTSEQRYANIRIEVQTGLRDIISRINSQVEMHGFSEVVPSMNDIFIRAVEGR